MTDLELWPLQIRGRDKVIEALDKGIQRICLTAPTGTGKSETLCQIILRVVELGWKAIVYTNRTFLVEQLDRVLTARGIDFGIRASGYSNDSRFEAVQISSLQTEDERTLKAKTWRIHGEGGKCLAICDEAHVNKGEVTQAIQKLHLEAGHCWLGISATPVDIGELYDHLIVAGNMSDGRACGALVPAYHYGPDEPDLKGIKGLRLGEDLSENQCRSAMMRDGIFGRVIEQYFLLNPKQRPSLLFAPGVPESLWFAEQFSMPYLREESLRQYPAIPAAHIDGNEVWINGKSLPANEDSRKALLQASKSGEVKVVCNRFVLREGVDMPWIEHLTLATIFGSLKTYLQSVGRGVRSSPKTGKTHLIIQDHGGNWWRHGSVNADRIWRLEYESEMIVAMRHERLRDKKRQCRKCRAIVGDAEKCLNCGTSNELEPYCCPKCKAILNRPVCKCGYAIPHGKRSRSVVQNDGTLKEIRGDIFRSHRICTDPRGPARWERIYYRSRSDKGARTFRAAAALFAVENKFAWPDRSWPFMPVLEADYFRLVSKVPFDRLIPKPS